MRHLHASDLESTLARGSPIEQFLGAVAGADAAGIGWIELRPAGPVVQVWRHEVEDVGDEDYLDVYGFPGLGEPDFDDPDYMSRADPDDGIEPAPVAVFDSIPAALAHAASALGASPARWVNHGVVQDEYRDFIRAGRPAAWPVA